MFKKKKSFRRTQKSDILNHQFIRSKKQSKTFQSHNRPHLMHILGEFYQLRNTDFRGGGGMKISEVFRQNGGQTFFKNRCVFVIYSLVPFRIIKYHTKNSKKCLVFCKYSRWRLIFERLKFLTSLYLRCLWVKKFF